jgi:hypothetical protein
VPITRTEEGRRCLAPRGGWTSLIEPRPVQGWANADAALDVAIRPPFAERAKAVTATLDLDGVAHIDRADLRSKRRRRTRLSPTFMPSTMAYRSGALLWMILLHMARI